MKGKGDRVVSMVRMAQELMAVLMANETDVNLVDRGDREAMKRFRAAVVKVILPLVMSMLTLLKQAMKIPAARLNKHLAEVHYYNVAPVIAGKQPDLRMQIKILALKGFLSFDQIVELKGPKAAARYALMNPSMACISAAGGLDKYRVGIHIPAADTVQNARVAEDIFVSVGDVYSEEQFRIYMALMKKAGQNFSSIPTDHRDSRNTPEPDMDLKQDDLTKIITI
jgi:hypothetical protein